MSQQSEKLVAVSCIPFFIAPIQLYYNMTQNAILITKPPPLRCNHPWKFATLKPGTAVAPLPDTWLGDDAAQLESLAYWGNRRAQSVEEPKGS